MEPKSEIQLPVVVATQSRPTDARLLSLTFQLFESDHTTRAKFLEQVYTIFPRSKFNLLSVLVLMGDNDLRRIGPSETMESIFLRFSVKQYFTSQLLLPVLVLQVGDLKLCTFSDSQSFCDVYNFGLIVRPEAPSALFDADWLRLSVASIDPLCITNSTLSLFSAVEKSYEKLLPFTQSKQATRGCAFLGMHLTQTMDSARASINITLKTGKSEPQQHWMLLPHGVTLLMNLIKTEEAKRASLYPHKENTLVLSPPFMGKFDLRLPKPRYAFFAFQSGVQLDTDLLDRVHTAFVRRTTLNSADIEEVWGPVTTMKITPDPKTVSAALSLFCTQPKGSTMKVDVYLPSPSVTEQVAIIPSPISLSFPWDCLQCSTVDSWFKVAHLATFSAYFSHLMQMTPVATLTSNLPFSWIEISNTHTLFTKVAHACQSGLPESDQLSSLVRQSIVAFIEASKIYSGMFNGIDVNGCILGLPVALSIKFSEKVPLVIITEKDFRVFFNSKASLDEYAMEDLNRHFSSMLYVFRLAVLLWSCSVRNGNFRDLKYNLKPIIEPLNCSVLPTTISLDATCKHYLMVLADLVAMNTSSMDHHFPEQDKQTRNKIRSFDRMCKESLIRLKDLPGLQADGSTLGGVYRSLTGKHHIASIKDFLCGIFKSRVSSGLIEQKSANYINEKDMLLGIMGQLKKAKTKNRFVVVINIEQNLLSEDTMQTQEETTIIFMDESEEITSHKFPFKKPIQTDIRTTLSTTITYAGSLSVSTLTSDGSPSTPVYTWTHSIKPSIFCETATPFMRPETIASSTYTPVSLSALVWNEATKELQVQFLSATTPRETSPGNLVIAQSGITKYATPGTPFSFFARSDPVLCL